MAYIWGIGVQFNTFESDNERNQRTLVRTWMHPTPLKGFFVNDLLLPKGRGFRVVAFPNGKGNFLLNVGADFLKTCVSLQPKLNRRNPHVTQWSGAIQSILLTGGRGIDLFVLTFLPSVSYAPQLSLKN